MSLLRLVAAAGDVRPVITSQPRVLTKSFPIATLTWPSRHWVISGKLVGEKPLTLLLPLVRAKLKGATPRLFAKLDMTLACALKRLLTPLLLMATLQQCEISAEVDSLCNCVKATAQSGKLPVIFRSSARLKLPLSRDCSMFMSNDLQPLQAENMCVRPTFLWQRP